MTDTPRPEEPSPPRAAQGRAKDAARPRSRADLLQVFSDELLTPATVLQGVAQTLAARADLGPDERRELARSAERAGRRLRRLVENIFLADDLRSGRIGLARRTHTVEELVSDTVEHFEDEARLRVHATPEARSRTVSMDLKLASRALAAVIENALEFSPESAPVDVRVEAAGAAVEILVADRGPGIPEDIRPSVFELFVQGHEGDTRGHRGLGIGLYLAASIVRAHGGTIDAATLSSGQHAVIGRFPA